METFRFWRRRRFRSSGPAMSDSPRVGLRRAYSSGLACFAVVKVSLDSRAAGLLPSGAGAALSLPRRHQTSSGASSLMTMPGTTMNLQRAWGGARHSPNLADTNYLWYLFA